MKDDANQLTAAELGVLSTFFNPDDPSVIKTYPIIKTPEILKLWRLGYLGLDFKTTLKADASYETEGVLKPMQKGLEAYWASTGTRKADGPPAMTAEQILDRFEAQVAAMPIVTRGLAEEPPLLNGQGGIFMPPHVAQGLTAYWKEPEKPTIGQSIERMKSALDAFNAELDRARADGLPVAIHLDPRSRRGDSVMFSVSFRNDNQGGHEQ